MRATRDRPLRAAIGWMHRPAAAIAIVAGIFLVLPLLAVLPSSLTDSPFLGFPPHGLSSRWYAAVVTDADWIDAFLRSLRVAALGAAIALVLGTLAALGLARARRGAGALRAGFLLPVVIPSIAYALGFYSLLVHASLGKAEWVVAVGQSTLAFPVIVIVVSSALAAIDPALPRAATGLGASWWRVIGHVELPLIRRSLVGAFIVAFTLCFDEVVVALFLSPPSSDTIPTHIWNQSQDSLRPDIVAAGVVVIVSALVLLAAATLLLRRTPWRVQP